jgi:LysM repeat protein
VKKGETLQSIAKKRGMTVDALCKLNRIGKNIRLMPGQILKYN